MDIKQSLKKRVVVGGAWLYLLEFLSKGLQIVQTIILTRLLAPEHFGIIGIFSIFSLAIESVTQTGFRKALIQSHEIDKAHLNTAWTISIARGCILSALIFLGSPFVAGFLNASESVSVIRVLSLTVLMQGFSNIGTVYFLRNLEFKKECFWKMSGFLANFAISIPLAFLLRNEWAIVWGLVGSGAATVIASYALTSYRPVFFFDAGALKTLFHYGKWLLLSSVIVYFSKQGDQIIIAKFLGKVQLGIYVVALRFSRLPELFSKQIKNVLFPAYSKVQDNRSAMKNIYLQSFQITTLCGIPFVGMMVVFARPFVQLFLGEKWITAVFPMCVLTVAGFLNIIAITGMSISNAVGRTHYSFKLNCIWLVTLAAFIYPLITLYGMNGVALSYLVRSGAGIIMWQREMKNTFKIRGKNLFSILLPLCMTLLLMGCVLALDSIHPFDSIVYFFGIVMAFLFFYFILGFLIHKWTRFKIFAVPINILAQVRGA